MRPSPTGVLPSRLRAALARTPVLLVLSSALAVGCEDATGPAADLPFARTGVVRIEVAGPVNQEGTGTLRQQITWSSDGPWELTEGIYLDGKLGDETVRRSSEDPTTLAQRYAIWIAGVNDSAAVKLFHDSLSASTVPRCPEHQSTVTVQLVDDQRADSIAWTRCGEGTLATLAVESEGKDAYAARVIDAVKRLRDATLPFDRGDFHKSGYAYTGTLPFRTILRGERTRTPLLVPRVIQDQASWAAFWTEYIGPSAPVPIVDFGSEVVLVGAVGTRQEEGDSVEVRRVLSIGYATQVELRERRLGDFCTPAPNEHAPFHIVAAPDSALPKPIYFSVAQPPDWISCG